METEDKPVGLLSYDDVARWLKCCVKHVRDAYVKTGMLKVVRIGRHVRFRAQDVEALIVRLMGSDQSEGVPV